jgi:hypothetical protein
MIALNRKARNIPTPSGDNSWNVMSVMRRDETTGPRGQTNGSYRDVTAHPPGGKNSQKDFNFCTRLYKPAHF